MAHATFRPGDLVRLSATARPPVPGILEVVEVTEAPGTRERLCRVRAGSTAHVRTVPERVLKRA